MEEILQDLASNPGALSASAILAVAILMVFKGSLVPSKFYDAEREEKTYWREAYHTEKETSKLAQEGLNELLEQNKTTTKVIDSLPKPKENQGGSDV